MKISRGQALMEFTLILPVILLILLYMVEFGRIMLKKYELESNLDLIVTLYEDGKNAELNNFLNQNNISVSYKKENGLTTISIKKNVDSNLPLIKSILGTIETRRTIYEKE